MKNLLPKLLAVLMLLSLLVGCSGGGNVATGGDLPPASEAERAATAGDVQADSLETLLLSENGVWRSEQQDAADAGVTVRELNLQADGSFSYREGDFASEFCYFASGVWTLEGGELRLTYQETDELGTPYDGSAAQSSAYTVEAEDGGMRLIQQGANGLCDSTDGLTVHFYHPIA